ncbi:MAG: hypothetical protein ACKO9H_09275, partial [Planctomycetota bacterium]
MLLAIRVRMWLSPEDCQIRLPRFTSLATVYTAPGFRAPTVKASVREFVATVVGRLDLPACLPLVDSFLERSRATCCFAGHAAPFK